MIDTTSTTAEARRRIGTTRDFLTLRINGQLFGIPILQVQDVLGEVSLSRIPLAPEQVAGSLNLRGRIVTAIDVRKCLGLPNAEATKRMSVVVEQDHELYSLIIDRVGDVLSLYDDDFENTPATLDPAWRAMAMGIYRLDHDLLVILDVPKLLRTVVTIN